MDDVERIRASREADRLAIRGAALELCASEGSCYSASVARKVEPDDRFIRPTTQTVWQELAAMEKEGLLVSNLEPSSRNQQPRRIFRLAVPK